MCFQHGPHRKWEAGPGAPQGSLLSSLCGRPRIRAPRPFYSSSRRQWVLRNVCVTLGARRYPRSLVSRLHLRRCVGGARQQWESYFGLPFPPRASVGPSRLRLALSARSLGDGVEREMCVPQRRQYRAAFNKRFLGKTEGDERFGNYP